MMSHAGPGGRSIRGGDGGCHGNANPTTTGRSPVLRGGRSGSADGASNTAAAAANAYADTVAGANASVEGASGRVMAHVKGDFTAVKDTQVSIKAGEIVEVLDDTKRWWVVMKRDGAKGKAPSNFLKLIPASVVQAAQAAKLATPVSSPAPDEGARPPIMGPLSASSPDLQGKEHYPTPSPVSSLESAANYLVYADVCTAGDVTGMIDSGRIQPLIAGVSMHITGGNGDAGNGDSSAVVDPVFCNGTYHDHAVDDSDVSNLTVGETDGGDQGSGGEGGGDQVQEGDELFYNYIAICDYTPKSGNLSQLAIEHGEMLHIHYADPAKNWWVATNTAGKEGKVAKTYVQVFQDSDEDGDNDEGENVEYDEDDVVAENVSLLEACFRKNYDDALMYLNTGADPNETNEDGFCALYVASQRNCLEIVKALLSHGAEVNMQEEGIGATPLYVAAHLGHANIAKELLKRPDILPDIPTHTDGATPLIVAAAHGHGKVVVELLLSGVERGCKLTTDGTTAEDCADAAGYTGIVKLLRIDNHYNKTQLDREISHFVQNGYE